MSSSPAIREDQEKWGLYHKNIANCEHSAQRAQFCLGCSVGQAEEMAGQEEQMAWAKVEEMTEQVPPGAYDTSVSLRWSVVWGNSNREGRGRGLYLIIEGFNINLRHYFLVVFCFLHSWDSEFKSQLHRWQTVTLGTLLFPSVGQGTEEAETRDRKASRGDVAAVQVCSHGNLLRRVAVGMEAETNSQGLFPNWICDSDRARTCIGGLQIRSLEPAAQTAYLLPKKRLIISNNNDNNGNTCWCFLNT